jgi:hypothetical protein
MTTRTLKFLPEYLRTTANKKFLNATLEQLTSEPRLKKINGFVGRKLAPGFNATDNYISETQALRENYQFEPTVVVKRNNQVEFESTYADLLQQIEFLGGNTANQQRLFANDSYSYNGHFDFDKLVNFNKYYWMPIDTGPGRSDVVDVGVGFVPESQDFVLGIDFARFLWTVDQVPGSNPDIVLVRGGTYKFEVSDQGPGLFWIQTDTELESQNRTVLGLDSNGISQGTIEFQVPLRTAQDNFLVMPLATTVDLATTATYASLQNQPVTAIDGQTQNLSGRRLIFVDQSADPADWGSLQSTFWNWIFEISIVEVNGVSTISLQPVQSVSANNRVQVTGGSSLINTQYWISTDSNLWQNYPAITANLDVLYYRNSSQDSLLGRIVLVDFADTVIDVEADILGQTRYTSVNGVEFTNGLRVQFDSQVTPAKYSSGVYYVEGVGTGIRLISESDLTLAVDDVQPDYITAKRSSADLNDWSRRNRWVHESVLQLTAQLRDQPLLLPQQQRAARPIIEFDADLQLFEHGRVFLTAISQFNTTVQDALSEVAGAVPFDMTRSYSMGVSVIYDNKIYRSLSVNPLVLTVPVGTLPTDQNFWAFVTDVVPTGTRILFAGDIDSEVRFTVYEFLLQDLSGVDTVLLQPMVSAQEHDIVIVDNPAATDHTQGYYLLGGTWQTAQRKTQINQRILFDLVNDADVSLSKSQQYSSFQGCTLFDYRPPVNGSLVDSVLGFPVSYANFDNLGDLEFVNRLETDTYQYYTSLGYVTEPVSVGYLAINQPDGTRQFVNNWTKTIGVSKQYQQVTFSADGTSSFYALNINPERLDEFEYDIRVFVNNVRQAPDSFSVYVGENQDDVLVELSVQPAGTKIDVLIYHSRRVDPDAFYQVPSNLEINPLNQEWTTATLGQMRTHTRAVLANLRDLRGSEFSANNSRDIYYKNQPGTILQHAAPVIYAHTFLTHPTAKFVESVQKAAHEYVKFKNRFLELSAGIDAETALADIPAAVDQVMRQLVKAKSVRSPWQYSDMVAFGVDRTRLEYDVLDLDIKTYALETIFDNTQPSSRCVLVYLNGVQLALDRDYVFDQTTPSVVLSDSLALTLGDRLAIVDYVSTDGSHVPETPAKLGLADRYVPEIYVDNTYSTPVTMIQGHDGSQTPAFRDQRDAMLLELELRIFNNIKTQFDIDQQGLWWRVKSGQYRQAEYSSVEITSTLSKFFARWAGANQLDPSSNTTFASSDSKTWNYSRSTSAVDSSLLQGHWRAIYRHYFDTDRPHSHPWEMLGFAIKPTWWEQEYGPAPWTGGNLYMWTDLQQGLVRQGPRAGVDLRFARPGLVQFVPVDDQGRLKTPNEFLVRTLDSSTTAASWAVGQFGPVETAWARSSDWAFAQQIVLALTRPAEYFGLLINTHRYRFDPFLQQTVFTDSKQRVSPDQVVVNGPTARAASWLNWIAEYLNDQGQSGQDVVQHIVQNLNVQLSYRMAGYSDHDLLQVFAEQTSPTSVNSSVLIPDENRYMVLHKSTPLSRVVYSAVIVRRTRTGFAVEGYDLNNPVFTVIPSRASSNSYTVTAGNQRGIIYQDFANTVLTVPYGFEFRTRQQVVDFLVSYQRYLVSQGLVFDQFNESLRSPQDWTLSVREFLFWTQQGWNESAILVLSPALDTIKLLSQNTTVDEIVGGTSSSRMLDQNFSAIGNNDYDIDRDQETTTIRTLNRRMIALADLSLVQYEHILVLDNRTVFDDVIYEPETGSRQSRVRLQGLITDQWAGRVDPPGYMYFSGQLPEWSTGQDYALGDLVRFKGRVWAARDRVPGAEEFDFAEWTPKENFNSTPRLLPNLATNAVKFIDIYNVDADHVDSDLQGHSASLIGFRRRDYLDDLGVDEKTQIKFYQGYIKQKGTAAAVNALTAAQFDKLTSDIDFAEEWAIRRGTYGAVDNRNIVEFVLQEQPRTPNPFGVELVNNSQPTPRFQSFRVEDLLSAPLSQTSQLFAQRNTQQSYYATDLTYAGFVHPDDVDATVFDITDTTLIDNQQLGNGYLIWTAQDFDSNWNVYRATTTGQVVTDIEYGVDLTAVVTTQSHHNLDVGQVVSIQGFDPELDGIYRVLLVDSLRRFVVGITPTVFEYLREVQSVESRGYLLKMQSVKFDALSDIQDNGTRWLDGDKLWIGQDSQSWQVLEKTSPWQLKQSTDAGPTRTIKHVAASSTVGPDWGKTISLSPNQTVAAVGNPTDTAGTIELINLANPNTPFVRVLNPPVPTSPRFAQSVVASNDRVIAGCPGFDSQRGYVAVYSRVGSSYIPDQLLLGNAISDQFGWALAVDRNATWLYASSLGAQTVRAYRRIVLPTQQELLQITGGQTVHTLDFAVDPVSVDSLRVFDSSQQRLLIPGVDYTVSGDQLTFTAPPADGNYQVFERTYYQLVDTITQSGLDPSDQFGWAIRTTQDGRQLLVATPNSTEQSLSEAGSIYVYDRTVEAFVASEDQLVFDTQRAIDLTPAAGSVDDQQSILRQLYGVSVNGSLIQSYNIKSTQDGVIFDQSPIVGSVVAVETNKWLLIEKLTSSTPATFALFGSALDVCSNNCSIYASSPLYRTGDYLGGIVEWFLNEGRVRGTVLAATANPTVTVGHSIRLNDFEVEFTGTSLADVVEDINSRGIPGVRADIVNDRLRLDSDSRIAFDRLQILPGVGSALSDLGLTVFRYQQTLTKPDLTNTERFGHSLSISSTADRLFVGSLNAVNRVAQQFSDGTTFDRLSTTFFGTLGPTGSVFEYEFVTDASSSRLLLVQDLSPEDSVSVDNFGLSVVSRTTLAMVSSGGQTPTLWFYVNPDLVRGWQTRRTSQPLVDLDSVQSLRLYDRVTGLTLTSLDYIDPARGKILGVADQSIDFKTAFDPAVYQDTPSMSDWAQAQEGLIWWNLAPVRFIDYQQHDRTFRMDQWSSLFPGSRVEVYQWIASAVPPAELVDTPEAGIPFDVDRFNTVVETDALTGLSRTTYYFWARGLEIAAQGHGMGAAAIERAITDPKQQNIPYAAVLDTGSLALYNCSSLLNGDRVVLRVETNQTRRSLPIHNEWKLLRQRSDETIPVGVFDRLIDSLTGVNSVNQTVPDPDLPLNQRYGIQIRPRQSMFVDRRAAVREFLIYVNQRLRQTLLLGQIDFDALNEQTPLPDSSEWDLVFETRQDLEAVDLALVPSGTRILVISDSTLLNRWTLSQVVNGELVSIRYQTYRIPDFWQLVDWYSVDFAPGDDADFVINEIWQLGTLSLQPGQTARVLNSGSGLWAVFQLQNNRLVLVAHQSGTVEFSDIFYRLGAIGWDSAPWDSDLWDFNPSREFRRIVEIVYQDLSQGTLRTLFTDVAFVMFNYVMSEQLNPDWLFKTSFVSVLHRIRKLEQYPIFVRDNQDYYQSYINEVKPYKTKIREYLLSYDGQDLADFDVTDFDLPVFYDPVLGRYRTLDVNNPLDQPLLQQYPLSNWNDNYTMSIDSVEVINGGENHTRQPTLRVVGGDGRARLTAVLGAFPAFSITDVEVDRPGGGFLVTPEIQVFGASQANLLARLGNDRIRTVTTELKFDRMEYSGEIAEWQPNTQYQAGDFVLYEARIYAVTGAWTSDPVFVEPQEGDPWKLATVSELDSAMKRAVYYYRPNLGQPSTRLEELFAGVGFGGVSVTGGSSFGQLEFDIEQLLSVGAPTPTLQNVDVFLNSTFLDTSLGTRPEDIETTGGAFVDPTHSHAPEELIPGRLYDTLEIRVFTEYDNNGNTEYLGFRVFHSMNQNTVDANADFDPTVQLAQPLASGDTVIRVNQSQSLYRASLTYPGRVVIGGETIQYTGLDTANNTLTGLTRGIDGSTTPAQHPAGSFVGLLDDLGRARSYSVISAAHTTRLAQPLLRSDTAIRLVDSTVLARPDTVQNRPGVIFVNGERIVFWTINYQTHTLEQISRGTLGTGVPATHAVDSLVSDASADRVLENADSTTWLNPGVSTVTDGLGLAASNTSQAGAMRASPSYNPSTS